MHSRSDKLILYMQAVKWARSGGVFVAPGSADLKSRYGQDSSMTDWLRKSQIIGCLPELLPPADRFAYELMWQYQRTELLSIFEVMRRLDIAPMLFKGAAVVEQYLHSGCMLLLRDCDVIVDKSQLALAKTALKLLGFSQGSLDSATGELVPFDEEDILNLEARHYQTLPFLKKVSAGDIPPGQLALVREFKSFARAPNVMLSPNGNLDMIVEIDLHFGIAPDVDADILLADPKRLVEREFSFPGLEGHLWFLCARYYNELAMHQKRSLRDTLYISCLLGNLDAIDFDYLEDLTIREEQHCALFYILSTVSAFGEFASPELDRFLGRINPVGKGRTRDWGWLLGRFFDAMDDPFFAKELPGAVRT